MSFAAKPLPPEDLAHVHAHTHSLWEEARGQSFFITGGTGFFGMWLLESFVHINDTLGLGMRATVLTRDPEAFARKAPHLFGRADLAFIAGDVRTFDFPAGRFTYVIHAATEASAKLNEEAPHEMLDAIVSGTRRVLEFAAQSGVKKLLLTSSGAVYGRQPSDITHVSEDYLGAPDPLLSDSAYGEGKRVSEHLCAVFAHRYECDVKIARCFAFVGPHLPLNAHFAIGNFIRDAMRGDAIQIGGDGTPARSYLYSADLAIWLWTILFRAPSGRAYNVGSAESMSIEDVARAVSAISASPPRVVIAREKDPTRPISRYVPAVARAEGEFGLRVTVPLDEAIRKTVSWYRLSSENDIQTTNKPRLT